MCDCGLNLRWKVLLLRLLAILCCKQMVLVLCVG